MKIAGLSDIHDHIWNLEKVLDQIKGGVEAIIFCGDMCAPFTAKVLGSLNIPIYACLGNNDEDHIGMMKKGGSKFTWFHLSQEFGQVKLDGEKIAFCHYPKLAELLAKTEDYDAVFHGHTHVSRNEKRGKTLLLNPGAVCGIQDGKSRVASYSIYDTKTNSARIIEFK